jgi:hypothetical protein
MGNVEPLGKDLHGKSLPQNYRDGQGTKIRAAEKNSAAHIFVP